VVCIGKYGDIPKIPEFPRNKGPEIFQGKVLHSIDYCKLDKEAASQLLKGKKVAVIGFKKSAIDLALECAEENQGTYIYIYKRTLIMCPLEQKRENFGTKDFNFLFFWLIISMIFFPSQNINGKIE
jgi:cation diffusion facilitator CzcD-associated flavoprotein CzcO